MARLDRQLLAASRLLENAVVKVTPAREHVAIERGRVDSIRDHTAGASAPTATPHVYSTERCTHLVPGRDRNPDNRVECGRTRPCGQHDDPVRLTPVERAAEQRLKLQQEWNDIEAHIKAAAHAAAEINRGLDRILGTRIAAAPRCDATGRDGAIEWADFTCTAIPSRGPLCERCSKREYRWRKTLGLPPRTDGVFAHADLDVPSHTLG